jgi:hypothetical protein
VSDIRSSIADISVHLAHDSNVFVTVEERVLLVSDCAHSARRVRSLVRLETGIREHHNKTLGVLVVRSNRDMLLGYQLG